MNRNDGRLKLVASCVVALWLMLVGQRADAVTVAPANPTITVGQNQQFTATGAARTPTAVSAGAFFSCVSFSDGTAQCTGRNQFGQLGSGEGTFTTPSVPVAVSGLTTPTPVVPGAEHACALLGDSTVRCWGAGDSGQRGDGTFNNSSTVPIAVVGSNGAGAFTGAVTVVTGGYHTCALLGDGTMWCWGRNAQGQLGDGTASTACAHTTGLCSPIPVRVGGITSPLSITAGCRHPCALLGDGTVRCWGRNLEGELGDGTTTSSSTPVRVGGITSSAVAIAAGHGGLHTCALLSDGSVKCWGALGPGNDVGQLGNGSTTGSATPVTMTGTGGTAVTWTESSNGAVATIDATGLATGRGPGTTTITATAGSGASASTTLTVNPAPVAPTITTQPASQTVTAGQTATFAVTAIGTAPLNYQWQKAGAPISGATQASYITPPTTSEDNGAQFTVVVSNTAGSVPSSVATLTGNSPPTITTQPARPTAAAGPTPTLSGAATGARAPRLPWPTGAGPIRA